MDDLENLSEPNRLKAVVRSRLLDSGREPDFDQLTRLAARLLGTPSAFVTVISEDRQFIKSAVEDGQPSPLAGISQPLDMSFCKYTVASGQPLLVENAHEHEVLKDHKAVAGGVVAYAGIPLETRDGEAVGALCVVDSKPRHWSEEDIDNLRTLARSAMKLIDERSHAGEQGGEEGPDDLLECATLHLRALDDYSRFLKGAKSLDFAREAELRGHVIHSFTGLVKSYQEVVGANGSPYPELVEAAGKYIDADTHRSESARAFAAGELELRELEGAIGRHMEAVDSLRVTALNCGAEL